MLMKLQKASEPNKTAILKQNTDTIIQELETLIMLFRDMAEQGQAHESMTNDDAYFRMLIEIPYIPLQ